MDEREWKELPNRIAAHITALVFDQIDNNGEWMIGQDYTEKLVKNALKNWRKLILASRDEEMGEMRDALNLSLADRESLLSFCGKNIEPNAARLVREGMAKAERLLAAPDKEKKCSRCGMTLSKCVCAYFDESPDKEKQP
jgi:hypothetical protein